MMKWIKHIKDTYNTYNERVRLSKELFKYIKSIDGIFISIPLSLSRFNNNICFIINNPYNTVKSYISILQLNKNNIEIDLDRQYQHINYILTVKYTPYSKDIDRFLVSQKIQGNY